MLISLLYQRIAVRIPLTLLKMKTNMLLKLLVVAAAIVVMLLTLTNPASAAGDMEDSKRL